jgi:hypothetical protein
MGSCVQSDHTFCGRQWLPAAAGRPDITTCMTAAPCRDASLPLVWHVYTPVACQCSDRSASHTGPSSSAPLFCTMQPQQVLWLCSCGVAVPCIHVNECLWPIVCSDTCLVVHTPVQPGPEYPFTLTLGCRLGLPMSFNVCCPRLRMLGPTVCGVHFNGHMLLVCGLFACWEAAVAVGWPVCQLCVLLGGGFAPAHHGIWNRRVIHHHT